MLYELLTGRLPFEAETPLAAATRRMVADVPPLVAYRNDIPWPLQEVVLVALRRDASERYKNAHEMAEALRWSREQSPKIAPGERGLWVLGPRSRRQTEPMQPMQPMEGVVHQAETGNAPHEREGGSAPPAPARGNPVLRVAPPSIPFSEGSPNSQPLTPGDGIDLLGLRNHARSAGLSAGLGKVAPRRPSQRPPTDVAKWRLSLVCSLARPASGARDQVDGGRAESSAAALRWGSGGRRRNLAMNRGQWMAVAGGAAVGLVGMAAGVALSRREGREAARRWLTLYGMPLAGSAKQFAASAVEQYQAQMPKAVEALNTYAPQARDALGNLVAQAPQVASAVFGALPAVNGAKS